MRLGLLAGALLLTALPARGDMTDPLREQVLPLTSIDAPPSAGASPLSSLLLIAQEPTMDPWIAIRAIRAMGDSCAAERSEGCSSSVHDALFHIIEEHQHDTTGAGALRLRAAVEAVGAARALGSSRPSAADDAAGLLPLLDNPRRDVRATVVRTLGTSCSAAVKDALSKRTDPSPQVQGEIIAAVQALVQCPALQ